MSFIVGLTGGIGSGKSFVADYIATQGIEIVDADIIAREVVEKGQPALTAIEAHFGKDVITNEGELNRTALRQQVFSDTSKGQWLNDLLHPLIREKMKHTLAQANGPYVLFVVPLLIENQLYKWCDKVVVVDVSESTQIERASHRDNANKQDILDIIKRQVSREERLKFADIVIDNEGPKTDTLKLAQRLHNNLLKMSHD